MTARDELVAFLLPERHFVEKVDAFIQAIEAEAVAATIERYDELIEALDAYMDPENQFTHSRWHAVEEARERLATPDDR